MLILIVLLAIKAVIMVCVFIYLSSINIHIYFEIVAVVEMHVLLCTSSGGICGTLTTICCSFCIY